MKEAKAFCSKCKVQQECLRYALDMDLTGIWSGTTEKERKKMKG